MERKSFASKYISQISLLFSNDFSCIQQLIFQIKEYYQFNIFCFSFSKTPHPVKFTSEAEVRLKRHINGLIIIKSLSFILKPFYEQHNKLHHCIVMKNCSYIASSTFRKITLLLNTEMDFEFDQHVS